MVTVEGLALRSVADVPQDDLVVRRGGDGEAPVGAEDAALDDAVVAAGGEVHPPGPQVGEAYGAVAPAE